MACIVCGAETTTCAVKCAKFHRSICMKHCKDCEYFSGYNSPIVHCFYRDNLKNCKKQK